VTERFHRPARVPNFNAVPGGEDPAQLLRTARETAHALVNRMRDTDDPEALERLAAFTDESAVDAVAELWARSSPKSLAGALWRIYLLRVLIRQTPELTSSFFQRGTEVLGTIDAMVAGASTPTGPAEVQELADRILHGLFRGDFAVALERAAAFCRVTAAGATSFADDYEALNPERSTDLTSRALRLTQTAEELTTEARLWRAGSLD
jgi:hypothetical protein